MTVSMRSFEPADLRSHLGKAIGRYRGYTCAAQEEIVNGFHAGRPRDILGILPTGMGKSLGFLYPTYLWREADGQALTVVVSPILALMQDQLNAVDRLNRSYGKFRLEARQLNSMVSTEERRRIRSEVRAGAVNVLYLGPETLVQPWTYELLADAASNRILRGLVVDEAHMIAEWGDQFRPAFKRIGPVRQLLLDSAPADAPLRTLVMTATLPPDRRAEVLRTLGLAPDTTVMEHRHIRGEHFLRVNRLSNHTEKLRALVPEVRRLKRSGAGIIYCAQREHCVEIAELLTSRRLGPAVAFHGGTPGEDRREILRQFYKSRDMVVVATDAFGLGVDKPDVRWVLHFAQPGSIDAYYQEIGRAGRDGERCQAVLFYAPVDAGLEKKHALNKLTTSKFDARLRAMRETALSVSHGGRLETLIDATALPSYAAAPKSARSVDARTSRLHEAWNHASLLRAEQLGWLRLGPEIVARASVRLGPRASAARVPSVAPLLSKAGFVRRLRADKDVDLDLAGAASRGGWDPRQLQKELFDLIGSGLVRLADGNGWDTRVIVYDLISRHTRRVIEDEALRTEKQRFDANRVDEMGKYSRSKTCRRVHFFDAYGYRDLFKPCKACDVCAS